MNKSEVVGEVAARTGLNRKEAAGAVEAVFEAVTEALARREEGLPSSASSPPAPGPLYSAQSAHGRARGNRGFDHADVQARQVALRGRKRRVAS